MDIHIILILLRRRVLHNIKHKYILKDIYGDFNLHNVLKYNQSRIL